MDIVHKERTESTNDDAIALASEGAPAFTTVIADFQEKGRGRRGNSWSAPPGKNILFSTILRPTVPAEVWTRIPQIAGMELIHTVESLFQPNPKIQMKWPNDLYFGKKKWCGILVESRPGPSPFAILGIGVNCHGSSEDYPPDLRASVTTLKEIFEKVYPVHSTTVQGTLDIRLQIVEAFLIRLQSSLDQFLEDFSPVATFANRRDYLAGKRIRIKEQIETLAGTASGIGGDGELLLRMPSGSIRKVTGGTILEVGE